MSIKVCVACRSPVNPTAPQWKGRAVCREAELLAVSVDAFVQMALGFGKEKPFFVSFPSSSSSPSEFIG